jgi:valyl-tRNA synthetase
MIEIPKTYDPKDAERHHYARWEERGYFAPEINNDPNAPTFCIVIPPPNVTGSLHMGHALQHTMMDIMTRHKRMLGYRTLWLPGMDHAGISTQLMVTRELKKEGLTRHDLGREKFVERVWKWKEEYGGQILNQLRREGASVDWSRFKFTMDEDLSHAVREEFVRLYEEGLIYRGNRIVNWCPNDQTVLSDLEVQREPQPGKLFYLRYPFKDREGAIVVATTRPETMLGDTAVAVNPNDERYAALIGETLILPIVNREIRVVGDEFVESEFGTGAVKVTPAHDPNDYEMGIRHQLEQVNVIDRFARMTEEAGADFKGLDRYKARELVIEKLDAAGLLDRVVDYEFSISKCERCKTVIEPLISTQWFCRMDQLRDLALEKLRKDAKPQFVPQVPYEKVYADWLENLRDWTISRQLWWGHQIPAWYTKDGDVIVARTRAEAEAKAGTTDLMQDEDVLDTWFSSALWPFSTLGWPDETEDLRTFYPTSVLVTARDIIFLWVSRMMMTGLKFMGEEAFADVYVTGTILDKHGQRMSKTKGNGVDPLEVFDKYGVDATRLTLAQVGSTDTRWNEKQVESYRNFANKIWNAARFCLMNADMSEPGAVTTGSGGPFEVDDRQTLPLHDRWILSRLNKTAAAVNQQLDSYDFHAAVQELYHFFWDDFCDWYIELSKSTVTSEVESAGRDIARARLISILEQALRLLHPFMPYLTEELWQKLPVNHSQYLNAAYAGAEPTIMLASFPRTNATLIDESAETAMQAVIDLISRVRNIRSEMNIKPSDRIDLIIAAQAANLKSVFSDSTDQIARLTRAKEISINGTSEMPKAAARAVLAGGAEVAVPLEGLIDFAQERLRLSREKEKLQKEAAKLETQLGNTDFVQRAPAEKVEELRARVTDIAQRNAALDQMLEALS